MTALIPDNLDSMVAAGMPDSQIAKMAGVSTKTVYRWRKRRGLLSQWTLPSKTHGLASTYSAGCRCAECRRAHTRYQASLRAKRLSSGRVLGEHGKSSTYSNWGCRCERCRLAWRAEMRRQYEARQTATGVKS